MVELDMVPNITQKERFTKNYYKGLPIYNKYEKNYMILKREFVVDYLFPLLENSIWEIKMLSFPSTINTNFIIDMNGIDNFITSKELVFLDSDIREMALLHLYLHDKKIFRFGAAGARWSPSHPGGEVVEIQEIDYLKNTGKARSVSGYLSSYRNEESQGIILSKDGASLLEERAIYSHTAWIENHPNNVPMRMIITSKRENESVLSLIYEFCKNIKLDAAGIYAKLDDNKGIKINGRILKNIPQKAFNHLQEATDIAVEKEYIIPVNFEMKIYGTIYKRYEPEWEKFTNGREYEKRGHYHAIISSKESGEINEVFHVREITIERGISIMVELYPINAAYRIYPLEYQDGYYYIASSHKEVRSFADEFEGAISYLDRYK